MDPLVLSLTVSKARKHFDAINADFALDPNSNPKINRVVRAELRNVKHKETSAPRRLGAT